MRVLLGLCAVLLLGACNRVHSPEPLFSQADGVAAPALREGVWLVDGVSYALEPLGRVERCKVDTSKPVTRWKTCATWLLIRDGQILQLSTDRKEPEWAVISYLAVSGAPQILQVVDPSVDPGTLPMFDYFALTPTQVDAEGKAIAFESWPVQCGPNPPPTKKGENQRYLTLELNPGLIEDGNNCTAQSKEAVRAAAEASRSWQGEPMRARWIRDTYP